jgi:hypothetical protein
MVENNEKCHLYLTPSTVRLTAYVVLVVRVAGYRSRGVRFDSQRYHSLSEVVGLEWGPLVITIEELPWGLFVLTTWHPVCASPTNGGRLVDIVRSQTKATEFLNCQVSQIKKYKLGK